MESEYDFEFMAPQYIESIESASAYVGPEDSFFEFSSAPFEPAPVEKMFEDRVKKTARRQWMQNSTDNISRALEQLSVIKNEDNCAKATTFEGINLLPVTPVKKHSMITRLDEKLLTPILELRSRSVVRKKINLKRKASSPAHHVPPKYIAFNEQAYQFNYEPLPMFQSGPAECDHFPKVEFTSPLNPTLTTSEGETDSKTIGERETILKQEKNSFTNKNGTRSRDDSSANKPRYIKKFNWTDKDMKQEPFHFTAKTVAEKTYNEISKFSMGTRVAVLPESVKVELSRNGTNISCFDSQSEFLNMTVYERGKVMLQKKQEKITKIMEQENSRKLREFHANPMPTSVFSPRPKVKSEQSSRTILKEINYKELNTMRRARERQVFNQYLKDKEVALALERQKAEEHLKRIEQENITLLRRKLVHKALPLPPVYGSCKQ